MNQIQLSQCIHAAIGFFGLAWVTHYGWRQLAIDAYRQDLFEARDSLFDLAANSKSFGFDHPAYGAIRHQFHSGIRFAHRINMAELFVVQILRYFIGPESFPMLADEQINHKIATLDKETQIQIREIRSEWNKATIRLLLRTSPLFYVVFIFTFLRVLFSKTAPSSVESNVAAQIEEKVDQPALAQRACDEISKKFEDIADGESLHDETMLQPVVCG